MEIKKPENPPAFAFGYGTDKYERDQTGMTLRDYFASKVLPECVRSNKTIEDATSRAYEIADAMLSEREK